MEKLLGQLWRWLVGNGGNGADVFTQHAGNIAGLANGNGVKGTNESCFLWADSDTGATVDAGIPAYGENHRFFFSHIFLYSDFGLK